MKSGEWGGIKSFESAMDKRTDKTVGTWFLTALLLEVLQGNIFTFRGKHYLQKIGTAMGTKCAPSYANLFMHDLETQKLLGTWHGTQPYLWRRYIDDVMFFWRSTVEELELFIKHLNAQHPYIQFTAKYNPETRASPF